MGRRFLQRWKFFYRAMKIKKLQQYNIHQKVARSLQFPFNFRIKLMKKP